MGTTTKKKAEKAAEKAAEKEKEKEASVALRRGKREREKPRLRTRARLTKAKLRSYLRNRVIKGKMSKALGELDSCPTLKESGVGDFDNSELNLVVKVFNTEAFPYLDAEINRDKLLAVFVR